MNEWISYLCPSTVLLLLGDPVCVWSGCRHLGLHEQRHGQCTSSHSLPWAIRAFLPSAETSEPTPHRPQISKELINFYDSAYIKAVDVSGTPSKDAAIKVLDAFHRTVRWWWRDWQGRGWRVGWVRVREVCAHPLLSLLSAFSSTAAAKETTRLSSRKSSALCVPKRLNRTFWNLRCGRAPTTSRLRTHVQINEWIF